jgi:hypothetical protein
MRTKPNPLHDPQRSWRWPESRGGWIASAVTAVAAIVLVAVIDGTGAALAVTLISAALLIYGWRRLTPRSD